MKRRQGKTKCGMDFFIVENQDQKIADYETVLDYYADDKLYVQVAITGVVLPLGQKARDVRKKWKKA